MALTSNQITAKNFADFYQMILPYLNGEVPTFANAFNKSDLYSTDEKIIGSWIDGKPIYQRVIDFGSEVTINAGGTSSTWYDTNIDGSNIDKFTAIPAIVSGLPNSAGTSFKACAITVGSSDKHIKVCNAYYGRNIIGRYCTMQYTKLSDSVIKVGDGNDYSTDEQIIGTWIDGKTLYQKTVTGNTSSSAGWETHDLGIGVNVIDKVVSLNGVLYSTSGWHVGIGSGEANNELKFEVKPSTDKWEVYTGNIASHNNVPCVLTIRYTKK